MAVQIVVVAVLAAVLGVTIWRVVQLEGDLRGQAEQIRGLDRGTDVSFDMLRSQVTHQAQRIADLERQITSEVRVTPPDVTAQLVDLVGKLAAPPAPVAQPAEDPTSADDRGPGVPYVDDRDWSDDFIGRPPGAIPGLPDELRGVDPA